MERPLAIAFLWGLATGDMGTCLALGIFFELFWLDLFPAGTFVPPHAPAATLTALALVTHHGFTAPWQVLLAVILALPMAWLGSWLDRLRREIENRNYNRILHDARKSEGFHPERLVLGGLGLQAATGFAVFGLAFALLSWLSGLIMPYWARMFAAEPVSWPWLWLAASLGAVLSLRWRRAYVLLALGVAAVCALIFFETI